MNVFITSTSAFLPNDPITNDQIESMVGKTSGAASRIRKIVLRNNGIESRHYALDPHSRQLTHTNTGMTAEAIRKLQPWPDFSLSNIHCLCCGTSTPDQLMPGHASMVHGELRIPPCEVISTAGICCAGMAAMKYAFAVVASGISPNAVAAGSELASTFFRLQPKLEGDLAESAVNLSDYSMGSFSSEFLKWMLSDGAGAVFLEPQPRPDRISLRIDWIELLSFANELETCMYAGAIKNEKGGLEGWRNFKNLREAINNNCFAIQQDVKLLNQEIIKTAVDRALPIILKRHDLCPQDIAWFLPHYSSEYFKPDFYNQLKKFGFDIPLTKWFTNLKTKGNTGAASIYIILDELLHSGWIQKDQKLLCFIPESGRFSICYMLLTAV